MMMHMCNYFALHFVKPLASNIFEFDIHIESALAMASHGYILGTHMKKHTLLNNVM